MIDNPQFEIMIVAALAAAACALPGTFLVLRRMSMLSDAVSHSILLGIVLAYFVTRDLNHPLLVVAAAATGVLVVVLVEALGATRLIKEDAAIGLSFPLFFSIGVILISKFAGNVHLDTDAVLLGELAFVPFNRLSIWGMDLGPSAMYELGGIVIINFMLIQRFYKELKLASFDPEFAEFSGFRPRALHYGLMVMVSITAVGAFDAVGSVLVVALMIAPPATAWLLTNRLYRMMTLGVAIGVGCSIAGYGTAHLFDVSIAGSMAFMSGVAFLLAFLFAPVRGYFPRKVAARRQKLEFAIAMLTVHLATHESAGDAADENRKEGIAHHLMWAQEMVAEVISAALERNLVTESEGLLVLTKEGYDVARAAVMN